MERQIKGIWIPIEIYLDKSVCWTAKLIFLEIDSFTRADLDCYISNEHLAEMFDISPTMVSKHISKLKQIGWVEQTRFDGKKRFLKSRLKPEFKADLNQTSKQTLTEVQGRVEPNFKENNNNYNNNLSNNDLFSDENKSGESKKSGKGKNGENFGAGGGEPKSLYQEMLDIYYEWFKERNEGVPPRIDGADGKALKNIISYFKTIYKGRPEPKGTEEMEVKSMLSFILGNWHGLDSFYQKQTKLTQINSNITNIINEFKNGKSKQANPKDKSADARASRMQSMFNKVDEQFAKKG